MNDKDIAKEIVSNYFKYLYETDIDAIMNLHSENAV